MWIFRLKKPHIVREGCVPLSLPPEQFLMIRNIEKKVLNLQISSHDGFIFTPVIIYTFDDNNNKNNSVIGWYYCNKDLMKNELILK